MDVRKEAEIKFYNSKNYGKQFFLWSLKSFIFFKEVASGNIAGKKVLDYGCGGGKYSNWLGQKAKEVVGIDLSENALDFARKNCNLKNVSFFKMDCEKIDFQSECFDIVFDSESFCSLNHEKAFSEISRVLKPKGLLVGMETLGHNPFTNLKREINKLFGKSTTWSKGHIFKVSDLKAAEKYFPKIETHYFHLISWIAIPFLKYKQGISFLNFLEKIDRKILKLFPFLNKYCFKIVFLMQKS